MKPVAENIELGRILMSASTAKIRVAPQVVPLSLSRVMAVPMSLLESFIGFPSIVTYPSISPMVAGMLSGVLTFRSTDLAVSRLTG